MRIHSTRRTPQIVAAGVMALALTLSGCASASPNTAPSDRSSQGTPVSGGTATIVHSADVSNFDPILGNSGYDHPLLFPIYDTLIGFTTDLEPLPGLAEDWSFVDEVTLELVLREGVVFHDGTPFDADAVKLNIERTNGEDSNVSDLKSVESVEVVDDHTVRLHLSAPDSSLLMALSDRGGMMVSPAAIVAGDGIVSTNPVGTGPFILEDHQPGSEIRYSANGEYWDEGKPYLDALVVRVIADENARINAVRTGQADLATELTSANFDSLKSSDLDVTSTGSLAYKKIYFNLGLAPFDDPVARSAVMHAIDRPALMQALNFGQGEVAYQPFPAEYWAAADGIEADYDLELAKKQVKESGLDTESFTLLGFNTPFEVRLMEALKAQLEAAGMKPETETIETNAALNEYYGTRSVNALLSIWTGRPDPQMTVNYLYAADSFYNVGKYAPARVTELLRKGAATLDQDERAEVYQELLTVAITDEALEIPLFFNPVIYASNPKLHGFEPNLQNKAIFSTMWMTP